jgi:hypothetical protein
VNQNFQEEIPLKLKSLLVITLFVVACGFASAQPTFGFASIGSALYCDYEQLNPTFGGNLWGGFDNYSVCNGSVAPNFPTISGFGATLAVTASNNGPISGKGMIYGDTIYSYEYGLTQDQWTVWTALKCNKFNVKTGKFTGKLSWVGVAGFTGVVAGTNSGYLSCTIPGTGAQLVRGSIAVPTKQ